MRPRTSRRLRAVLANANSVVPNCGRGYTLRCVRLIAVPQKFGGMPELSTAKSDRLAITVGRLHQVQCDFVEQAPDLRRQFLAEEVQRALSLVDRGEQKTFLEALRRQYASSYPSPANPSSELSAAIPRDVNCDAQVIEVLDSTLHELATQPDGTVADSPLSEEQAIQELCTALGISGSSIDPVRAIAMAGMLSQFSVSMFTLAWMAWRTIAPNSSVRRGGISQKLFARYVAGDPTVSREQVALELERLRQLIASLISAISQVGEQFAHAHLEKFAPAEIEQAVAAENRGGLFRSRQVLYWQKYLQLADGLDQAAIEAEIRRVIAQHAEHLMRGLGRP
jgi:hypothetical protein